MTTDALFRRLGPDTFAPTPHAGGAWADGECHFSAAAGLLVHAVEQFRARNGNPELQLARVSFDILGALPLAEIDVRVEMLRPGRTIELVQATAFIAGRSVITARAWSLVASDTADAAAREHAPLPAPEECPPSGLGADWPGGFITQLEARQAAETRPGRGAVWLRSSVPLLEGEGAGEVAEHFSRIDIANGVAPRQEPGQWAYPNVDMTVHLFRRLTGEWTGLDTTVEWGPTGVGVTSSVLHDATGPAGRVEQCLTLRRR